MNDYLREFYSHSNKHPHGWGVACLEKQEAMIEKKEPLQAAKSHYLKRTAVCADLCKNSGCPYPICNHWKCHVSELSSLYPER